MSSRTSATAIVAFGVVLAAVSASPAFAQTAENVMVVINEASPESVRIGEYYVAKRKIPPENVTRLKTAVADELDRAAYEFFIEGPISETLTRHATQDRIHYIVLTKGIPLRVRGIGGARRQHCQRRFRVDTALPQAPRHSDSARRARSESLLSRRPFAVRSAAFCASYARHLSGHPARWLHGRRRHQIDRPRRGAAERRRVRARPEGRVDRKSCRGRVVELCRGSAGDRRPRGARSARALDVAGGGSEPGARLLLVGIERRVASRAAASV